MHQRTFWTATLQAIAIACIGSVSAAETATWTQPDIDVWSYVNGVGDLGARINAPTYANLTVNAAQDGFDRNDRQEPARLAASLLAFERTSRGTQSMVRSSSSMAPRIRGTQ